MVFAEIRKAHERNKKLPGETTIDYNKLAQKLAVVYWHVDDDIDFQINDDEEES